MLSVLEPSIVHMHKVTRVIFDHWLTSEGCVGGQWTLLLDLGTQEDGDEEAGVVLPC